MLRVKCIRVDGKTIMVGSRVRCMDCAYEGLTGVVTKILLGDKTTGNETPDIHCDLKVPQDPKMWGTLEERFSELYGVPKKMSEIPLDGLVMSPDILEVLEEKELPQYNFADGDLAAVLALSETASCEVIDLYDVVAKTVGVKDTTSVKYDCREIVVAEDVQNMFFRYYEEMGASRESTNRMLLFCGSKVDKRLEDWEVAISDKFVTK